MRSPLVLMTVMIVVAAGAAGADPIQVTSSRAVTAFVSFTDGDRATAVDSSDQGTDAGGAFRGDVGAFASTDIASMSAHATQNTTVDAQGGHFFGSGAVDISSTGDILEIDVSRVESLMTFDFVLDRPTAYQLTATMIASDALIAQSSLGDVNVFPPVFGTPIHVSRRGVLGPGSYSFFAGVFSSCCVPLANGQASFEVDLRLSQTPEPASMALVGTALTWLGLGRRTRRPSESAE